jgi:hypothetical protein
VAGKGDLVRDRPAEGLAHAVVLPKMSAATFSAASVCMPLITCW